MTSLTARRSHLSSPLRVVRAQLTSPLPSRHTNITHLRTAISTEAERRGDVSITQFYWLFKKHLLSARLVSALVESRPYCVTHCLQLLSNERPDLPTDRLLELLGCNELTHQVSTTLVEQTHAARHHLGTWMKLDVSVRQ